MGLEAGGDNGKFREGAAENSQSMLP